jgi:hypothetical protein
VQGQALRCAALGMMQQRCFPLLHGEHEHQNTDYYEHENRRGYEHKKKYNCEHNKKNNCERENEDK